MTGAALLPDLKPETLHLLLAGSIAAAVLCFAVVLALRQFERKQGNVRLQAAIFEAAEHIGNGNLEIRFRVSGENSHVDAILGKMNDMLDHTQQRVEMIVRQTGYIGHEYGHGADRIMLELERIRKLDLKIPEIDGALAKVGQQRIRLLRQIAASRNLQSALTLSACDFATIIGEGMETLETAAQEKNLTMQAELEPSLMMGDGNTLNRMMRNLLDNAVRYTPERGTVLVTCHASGGKVHLTVEDSGNGVPADESERVFDAGYRAAETQHEEGSGLGLADVRDVVLVHQGMVNVRRSKRLGGACFFASFPALTQPAPQTA